MGILRSRNMKGLWVDVVLRAFLFTVFVILERYPPFVRVIQPEEMWMYKYPHSTSYVPVTFLWPLVLIVPTIVISVYYWARRDSQDAMNAILAITLGLSLNGAVTDVIKVIVGRPRPDFYWRCFPDGISTPDMSCTGPTWLVNDGRKSFPSGHSSFAFAGLNFVSLYLAGKLKAFNPHESGVAWRVCVVLAPIFAATCIALSRTCDYHHHWQDVVIGSILGLSISTISYRLYFPTTTTLTFNSDNTGELHSVTSCPAMLQNSDSSENLLSKDVKWI